MPHNWLIQQGLGLGVIPMGIGEALGLTRVFPEFELPGDELFLAAHPDLHRSPRVAFVWNHLRDSLRREFEAPGQTKE